MRNRCTTTCKMYDVTEHAIKSRKSHCITELVGTNSRLDCGCEDNEKEKSKRCVVLMVQKGVGEICNGQTEQT